MPAVADKSFLVTIGDRTVGGLVARDPMVGPWQVPVADCAVMSSGFHTCTGEAMAMGERTPLGLLDARASARMAVAEALTNIAAADVATIDRVVLSANWMAACGEPGEDANLFDAVEAVAMELCPALGISIPVGKDSLSMSTAWRDDAGSRKVVSPLSLIVSAFAPVEDVCLSFVPMLRTDIGESSLLLVDLGYGANRLGGSALALSHERLGGAPPDLDRLEALPALFRALSRLRHSGWIAAYHDRSDGGLATCALEMAFAGRAGLDIDVGALGCDALAALFCEEPGALLQVRDADLDAVRAVFDSEPALRSCIHRIGRVESSDRVQFRTGGRPLHEASRTALHRMWSETSYRMQRLRDDPRCADEEYGRIADENERGLWCKTTFDMDDDVDTDVDTDFGPDTDVDTDVEADTRTDTSDGAPPVAHRALRATAARGPSGTDTGDGAPPVARARPRVAILREQGINGHVEMAASFDRAGFDAFDVHMSDLASGSVSLAEFIGLAACGGFSFGDVLGAGGGWAHSIRFNQRCRDEFEAFFRRDATFTLGVCNGCQMLERLRDLLPGAGAWPRFVRNRSEQFEGRLVMTRIGDSPSIFLEGMQGSELPTVVAHGEGRAVFDGDTLGRATRDRSHLPALRRMRRQPGRSLSGESERFRSRRGRRHDARRTGDRHDASPGTSHPDRAVFLASRALGRERPMAADVQERPEVGGIATTLRSGRSDGPERSEHREPRGAHRRTRSAPRRDTAPWLRTSARTRYAACRWCPLGRSRYRGRVGRTDGAPRRPQGAGDQSGDALDVRVPGRADPRDGREAVRHRLAPRGASWPLVARAPNANTRRDRATALRGGPVGENSQRQGKRQVKGSTTALPSGWRRAERKLANLGLRQQNHTSGFGTQPLQHLADGPLRDPDGPGNLSQRKPCSAQAPDLAVPVPHPLAPPLAAHHTPIVPTRGLVLGVPPGRFLRPDQRAHLALLVRGDFQPLDDRLGLEPIPRVRLDALPGDRLAALGRLGTPQRIRDRLTR